MNGFYSFIVGWTLIILMFTLSLRTEGTRTITYYALWLSIVLMLVTHSDTLQTLIQGTGLLPSSEGQSNQAVSNATMPVQNLTGVL